MRIPIIAILSISLLCGYTQAFGSCESLHECLYANLEPDNKAEIIAPSGIIPLKPGQSTNIHIFGTVPEDIKDATIILKFHHPDGTSFEVNTMTRNDGIFSIWYSLGDTRNDEGKYEISGTYHVQPKVRFGNETPEIDYKDFPGVSFRAEIPDLVRGDHVVEILSGEGDCAEEESCYKNPDGVILPGQTVEWINTDYQVHRLHSTAIGYGEEEPEIIKDPRKTENFFDTELIMQGESAFVEFTVPATVLYACLFHPWMEGKIAIVIEEDDRIPQKTKSIVEIKEKEEEKRYVQWDSIPPKVLSNAGDMLEVEYSFSDSTRRSALAKITGPEGIVIEKTRVSSDSDGFSEYKERIQPTWPPGKYVFSVEPYSSNFDAISLEFVIEGHDTAMCPSINHTLIKRHGPISGCFADRIVEITGNDTIKIGKTEVTLTGSNPTEDTTSKLSQLCPVGSVGVVDRDSTLKADSRTGSSLRGEYLGVVYCDGTNVNRYLLDNGLATKDETGCLTTEFQEWAGCPQIEEIIDVVEEITETATEDNCMIALATRGTHLAHHVQVLREQRNSMIESGWEPVFLGIHAIYYSFSPHVSDMMRDNDNMMEMVRSFLTLPIMASSSVAGATNG